MKKITTKFKALAEENRLKIIKCLVDSEKCVCEIMECINIPQNLLSHHLKILRDNNLITLRKDGKWSHYSLNREEINKIKKFLNF